MPPGHISLQVIPNIYMTYTGRYECNTEVIQDISAADALNTEK